MTPMAVSASLTSSSLNGLMMASIFFITDPPGWDKRSNPHARIHAPRSAGNQRIAARGRVAERAPLAYEMGRGREVARVSGDGRATAGAGECRACAFWNRESDA